MRRARPFFQFLAWTAVHVVLLDPALAPSYFLECLVYNIPNQNFGWSLADSLAGALKWLSTSPLAGLKAHPLGRKAAVIGEGGVVLRRGRELPQVLRVFDSRRLSVVE